MLETDCAKKVADMEAQAVWRLRDCQELMKSRVSEEFVDTKLRRIEQSVTMSVLHSVGSVADR